MKQPTLILLALLGFSMAKGQEAEALDLVINETLFNPIRNGYDYVEGYNRSARAIDLSATLIATRNGAGDIVGAKSLEASARLLPPGAYFVVTPNEKWLRQHYLVPSEALVCEAPSMPSFPDDKGTVIFQNSRGTMVDELNYSDDWHFGLLTETEGVALERINYAGPTQDRNNWTSAASAAGYGTPGKQNSQFRDNLPVDGELAMTPAVFSPDNNGPAGFGIIQYTMEEPGYTVNLDIYDVSGAIVRHLLKNVLLGASGQFRWDGLDDRNHALASGIYILFARAFHLNGRTKKFKQAIVLQRRK